MGDGMEIAADVVRVLEAQRDLYRATLADINDLLYGVTVQQGTNVHHIAQAQHLAMQALGIPSGISGPGAGGMSA